MSVHLLFGATNPARPAGVNTPQTARPGSLQATWVIGKPPRVRYELRYAGPFQPRSVRL